MLQYQRRIYGLLVSGLGVQASWKRHQWKTHNELEVDSEIHMEQSGSPKKEQEPGPLKVLSMSCLEELRKLVAEGRPVGFIFDNINLVNKVAESVLGKIDDPMNGTCATAFEVYGANDEALNQSHAEAAFLSAPPLERGNILLFCVEKDLHRQLMIHTILRLVVTSGGEGLTGYLPLLEVSQLQTAQLIDLHQTRTYPLPTMETDESTIDGTIEVMVKIYAAAGIDTTSESFKKRIWLVAGDLKSLKNLGTAKEDRAGNDDPEYSFGNVTFIIGLFHTVMAAVTGFLILHFGRTTAGAYNPGSLHFHNRLLERKPIAINSPIPFTVAKNLIQVSLLARVLHCLTLVSGCTTIGEYVMYLTTLDTAQGIGQQMPNTTQDRERSWKQLVADATTVYDQYANSQTVEKLCSA
ncbi:unnamed protein product [Rhizoctonia solani]|uniref:DUF6589 domain-containing protein n=1 Tax=Rhizoctonia solani TaxID=456999 RepID=A0A8H3B2T8_9AGAM|nr:unnamed protein product [Rhizoctonia solani]